MDTEDHAEDLTPVLRRDALYYSDSDLQARFGPDREYAFQYVATVAQPLFIRTRDGWREYPGPAPIYRRGLNGWVEVVTGVHA